MTRIWAKRGSRPRAKRDRRFTWAYLFGAICPARGTGVAVVLPEVGIDAMNRHLAEISQSISVSATALLILDGAGWHSSPKLIVPENIVLMPLAILLDVTPFVQILVVLWNFGFVMNQILTVHGLKDIEALAKIVRLLAVN